MSDHNCSAAIVTCIDFRLQPFINKWIGSNFENRTYDRVAFAGGVFNLETLLQQIEISHRLHHIHKVVLINHEDCGAYGEEGNDQRHANDLQRASKKIQEHFPNLEVDTYYLHLNGTFEKIH